MLFYIGVGLYVLICFLLLGVVLLQHGKGGGIAAAFGGSSSQTAFGARSGATVLTRATTVLGTLFMVGAFLLTAAGRSTTGGSVVGGVEGPASEVPALPTGTPLTPPAGSGSEPPPDAGSSGAGTTGSGSTAPVDPPPAGGTGS